MERKKIVAGPVRQPLTETYEDRGRGAGALKGTLVLKASGIGGSARKRPAFNGAENRHGP